MKTNRDFEFTKKPISINSVVVIQNGNIIDNPFYNKLEKNIIIEWLFKNNSILTSKLKMYLKEYDSYNFGYNFENCYDYTINHFLKSKDKIFNSSYFGEDTDYSIEQYVNSSLKYIVKNYISDCNSKIEYSIKEKSDENDKSKFYIDSDKLVTEDNATKSLILKSEEVKFSDLDKKFNWLNDYKSYFIKKGYKEFDIMKYIAYMFFDINQEESDHIKKDNVLVDAQMRKVAKILGESKALIKLVTTELKKDAQFGDNQALDIIEIIQELVPHQKNGWKPEILREVV